MKLTTPQYQRVLSSFAVGNLKWHLELPELPVVVEEGMYVLYRTIIETSQGLYILIFTDERKELKANNQILWPKKGNNDYDALVTKLSGLKFAKPIEHAQFKSGTVHKVHHRFKLYML